MHDPLGGLTGRVLIVEDEPGIQKLLVRLVSTTGVAPLTVSSGGEALEHFPLDDSVILAILDLNLPDMSGMEVFRQLRLSHPTLPVLFSSGFDESAVAKELSEDPNLLFLRKPYQIAKFWEAFRTALKLH